MIIDEKLLADAMKASGAKTKRAAIELGLAVLLGAKDQQRIRPFRGKLKWSEDLERLRTDS